jgi:predicted nucleic acid-binding Zn ribbon protein
LPRPCPQCGQTFTGNRKKKHCSDRCRANALGKKLGGCFRCGAQVLFRRLSKKGRTARYCYKCRSIIAHEEIARALRGQVRRCLVCGKDFAPISLKQKFCSDRCNNRHWCSQKRAARCGAFVDVVFLDILFQRDASRCGICGQKVSAEFIFPHPMSATVDHIMPLSRGGKHEPQNVQLAHWCCNSDKKAKLGYQMRLFG